MAAPAYASANTATAGSDVSQRAAGLQSANNAHDKGQTLAAVKITTDTVQEYLKWHESYSVLICRLHKYAIKNLRYHLRDYHSGSTKEKDAVIRLFERHHIRDPKDVMLPPRLEAPFASLGKPSNAFICNEPECGYISINRINVRIHCNKRHGWKSSAEEREHWDPVWVQTFFKSAGLQKYFTVSYDEEENDSRREKQELRLRMLIVLRERYYS